MADLSRAGLVDATLRGANLYRVDLTEAVVRNTTLREADLTSAILRHANLEGADLTKCVMGATVMVGLDLSGVQGLETIQHERPSMISVDTIYRSKGTLPEVFLRGAGVPEPFIDAGFRLLPAGVHLGGLVLSVINPYPFAKCSKGWAARPERNGV